MFRLNSLEGQFRGTGASGQDSQLPYFPLLSLVTLLLLPKVSVCKADGPAG